MNELRHYRADMAMISPVGVTARPERIDYLVTNLPACDKTALQAFHDTNIKVILA